MRRFTRLTNGFSKKLADHVAAVHVHFLYYNLCRIHQMPGVTPAMAAGLPQRAWALGRSWQAGLAEREGTRKTGRRNAEFG
jgi:hypothetical protein